MNDMVAMSLMGGSCVLVLLIAALKRKAQSLLNFLVRTILGAVGIFFINQMLAKQGIMLAVGLNPITLLTTGTLGFGGLALLYGISAFKFL